MKFHPVFRAVAWAAYGAVALLAVACSAGDDGGAPGPPPTAFVWIDSTDAKVDTSSVELRGEAECDNCPSPSGWQYLECPAIACPGTTSIDISWTNHTTGASGPATHGIGPTCYCPFFGYGYCYSACNHLWWAWVPLSFGGNEIVVAAAAPAMATGIKSVSIERVPERPAWLSVQSDVAQVTLDWTAVAGATSYDLYWSTTPYGYSSLCTRIAGVAQPYTHAGLIGGVTYYYFVTALNGDAESFDSPRTSATPL